MGFWSSISSFAQKTDFSGNWVLDKSKSKMDERSAAMIQHQTVKAVQTATDITVNVATEQAGSKTKMEIGGGSRYYTFNGKETVTISDTPMGPIQVLCSGKLEHDHLQLITNRSFLAGPEGEITTSAHETWTLSGGGAVLTIKRKSTTPQGTILSEFVYKKA